MFWRAGKGGREVWEKYFKVRVSKSVILVDFEKLSKISLIAQMLTSISIDFLNVLSKKVEKILLFSFLVLFSFKSFKYTCKVSFLKTWIFIVIRSSVTRNKI